MDTTSLLNSSQRIAAQPTLITVTQAPLRGVALAREAGLILVWDQSDLLYLLDDRGTLLVETRAPAPILDAAFSDDGSLLAVLVQEPRLWLLGRDLRPLHDRTTVSGSNRLAIDAHGRYLAVASDSPTVQFFTRYGRQAGSFTARQPFNAIGFVPAVPTLIGIGAYGTVLGIDLEPDSKPGHLDAALEWETQVYSNIGHLSCSGDGSMILVSCFTHGVQRYDDEGRGEGAYHLPGGVALAEPDFAGRWIAAATLEGDLALLNRAGNVRWRERVARRPKAIQLDPLSQYLIYGLETGEVTRLDFVDARNVPPQAVGDASTPASGSKSRSRSGRASQSANGNDPHALQPPAWTQPVARDDLEAETAVLGVSDDPPRIVVLAGRNQAQVFDLEGNPSGLGPKLSGVGRILRFDTGYVAAATDRTLVLGRLQDGRFTLLPTTLFEISHLEIRPDTYGLAIVQERDRIGRANAQGSWIWTRQLRTPVEEIACRADGDLGLTTEDGQLLLLDASGQLRTRTDLARGQSTIVAAAPQPTAGSVRADGAIPSWITMARSSQWVGAHDADGRMLWQAPLGWEPWQLRILGPWILVTGIDGRAITLDLHGRINRQTRSPDDGGAPDRTFGLDRRDRVVRVSRTGPHLICSQLDGRVIWRAVLEDKPGPMAVGRLGVALLLGRNLAWFPHPQPATRLTDGSDNPEEPDDEILL